MIELPNFSQLLKTRLCELLIAAKRFYEDAINIGKSECVMYEGDFNLRDACKGLSDVDFYLSEYRPRMLSYKYA